MTDIVIEPKFKKRLAKKTPQQRGAILECISRLGEDHRHPGLHSHSVQGVRGVFEAYVDDANRVTFHWEDGSIVMRNHCNHDVLKHA
jgi:hypothetical protein